VRIAPYMLCRGTESERSAEGAQRGGRERGRQDERGFGADGGGRAGFFQRAVADGAVVVQERNAKFAQSVFESGIETLRGQAETNRAVMESLAEETGRQQDALRTMVQESVGAYMDFLNSAFFYSERRMEVTEEAAQEGARVIEQSAQEGERTADRTRRESRSVIQEADQN
jgi:hypothetical protein